MISLEAQGILELQTKLSRLSRGLEDGARSWMNAVSFHLAERAEMNAPILTGWLRSSIQPLDTQKTSRGFQGGVEATAPHAHPVHEMLAPVGSKGLGPISRMQPTEPEGGPMGGFIEIPAVLHSPIYLQWLGRMAYEVAMGVASSRSGSQSPTVGHTKRGRAEDWKQTVTAAGQTRQNMLKTESTPSLKPSRYDR